uniref:Uncharacterized protein n=1 Tax=Homalodisca liturata TaxID=320908 RepID=A0A1B6IKD9_9HEMI
MKLGNQPLYKLSCKITVRKIQVSEFLDSCEETHTVQIEGTVLGSKEMTFPLKLSDGQSLILENKSKYVFTLEFDSPHPVYRVISLDDDSDVTFVSEGHYEGIIITHNTPLHVKHISYKL